MFIFLFIIIIWLLLLTFKKEHIVPEQELIVKKVFQTKYPKTFKIGQVVSNNMLQNNLIHPGFETISTKSHNILHRKCSHYESFMVGHSICSFFKTDSGIYFVIFNDSVQTKFIDIDIDIMDIIFDGEHFHIVIKNDGIWYLKLDKYGNKIHETVYELINEITKVKIMKTKQHLFIFSVNDDFETNVLIVTDRITYYRDCSFELIDCDFQNETIICIGFENEQTVISYNFNESIPFMSNGYFKNHYFITEKGTFEYVDLKWLQLTNKKIDLPMNNNFFLTFKNNYIELSLFNTFIQKIQIPKVNSNYETILLKNKTEIKILQIPLHFTGKCNVLTFFQKQNKICYSKSGRNNFPLGIVTNIENNMITVSIHGIININLEPNMKYFASPDGYLSKIGKYCMGYSINSQAFYLSNSSMNLK
jgi:hypothetical protein